MRIPKLPVCSQYRVSIPALNGGVNLNDAPNLVEDNQLTDVQNMWWKDQALRSRPGFHTTEEDVRYIGATDQSEWFHYRFYPSIRVYESGEAFDYVGCFYENEGSRVISHFKLYCFNDKGHFVSVKGLTFDSNGSMSGDDTPYADDVYMFKSGPSDTSIGLYMLFNNGQIYTVNTSGNITQVQPSDMYAPLVLVNAKGRGESDVGTPVVQTGTFFEGYNLLCGAFRTAFTTDNTYSFILPQEGLTQNAGETVTIQYTGGAGSVYTWEIPPSEQSVSITIGTDQVYANFTRVSGHLMFLKDGVTPYPLPASVANNLIITAWKTDPNAIKKISHMKFSTWFGGDRSGINGGTRLFVSGNPDYPNLVHWSDINNPLYFPENNYAYIGESSQNVTGFGKQSDVLVIFKEHEIYSTQYVSGNAFTAQDVIDGNIVDVTANTAVFPITPINSGIGCDCPNSIQLCNNRLVWASSNGRVYGLIEASQWSERNVRDFSALVYKRLSAHDPVDLKNAVSVDYDGHYMLFVENRVYLLDYMDAAFQYYASYTDEKKAQRNMPWHLWEIPSGLKIEAFMQHPGSLTAVGSQTVTYKNSLGATMTKLYTILYSLEGSMDSTVQISAPIEDITVTQHPIRSGFQTKIFDFGSPERKKKIRRLYIGMDDESESRVSVSYVSDKGIQDDVYELVLYGTGTTVERALTPGVSMSCKFGMKLDSGGEMGVSNLVIRYELCGEAK